jgi:uncharacterized repeat protein (TIGR03806 family)
VLDHPLFLLERPGDAVHFYAIERAGRVVRWDRTNAAVTTPEVWCDIRDRVDTSDVGNSEQGLLGMAFHPDHASNGELFLSYTATHDEPSCSLRAPFRCLYESRVSRFVVGADGRCDRRSEEVLLDIEDFAGNHNGGHIAFDPTGMLVLGMGDGGSANDPADAGQRTDTLLGKMVRIDVDAPAAGRPYGIPADNPFVDQLDVLPEIWALGLRNPWRFSFDRDTGDLWVGDVGQGEFEEIDLVLPGGNYGWKVFEANACFDPSRCDLGGFLPPVVEYRHANGRVSVTGGYVYRGDAIPSLRGTYLFADFASKEVFALTTSTTGTVGFERRATMSGVGIASFAEDAAGELYVIDLGGALFRIDPAGPPPPDTFPTRLSETGCVDPQDPTIFSSGVIPYTMNHPFYSDGATKERGIGLPDGATATIEADGDITLPVGTVLVKSFRVDGALVETRLLVRHDDGEWAGYSYAWEGSDATLVDAGGRVVRLPGGQQWSFPSRAGCLVCHTAAAGRSLGWETGQLTGFTHYPATGRTAHQLSTLAAIGVFGNPPAEPERASRFPALDDEGSAVAERARTYLHVNCSMCHRPSGGAQGEMDLRHATAFVDSGLCDRAPAEGNLGVDGARLFAPGDPARSLVSIRMKRPGAGRMPLLGSNVVDDAGVAVIDRWIMQTTECPP